jgi:hypothetical protein
LRTYWTAAASISSSVVGGWKLWSTRMFLNMPHHARRPTCPAPSAGQS